MEHSVTTSLTRRRVFAGLALTAAPAAVFAGADNAFAQATQTMPKKSLYERLGGVFAIAAVVDHFSDAVVKNPVVGEKSTNPQLREWHTKNLGRLPGLKFMRTLWVCNVSGGPFQYTATKPGATPLGLEEAHRNLRISPAEFDEVAAELGRTLDFFKVPNGERRSKSWQLSPPTKPRSPPAAVGNAAEAVFFPVWTNPQLGGDCSLCTGLTLFARQTFPLPHPAQIRAEIFDAPMAHA